MPTTRELNVQMEDRPAALGKLCRTLADHGVNIIAFRASSSERQSEVHLIADKLTTARIALDAVGLAYTESEVAQITLLHRPGELARATERLGEARININYAYVGIDPATNAPLVFFGVTEVGLAAKILDQSAAATAAPGT